MKSRAYELGPEFPGAPPLMRQGTPDGLSPLASRTGAPNLGEKRVIAIELPSTHPNYAP